MRKLLIILTVIISTTCLVFCDQDQSVQTISVEEKSNAVQQNPESVKTKRGIHGYAGLRYLPPAPAYSGLNYFRHSPYASFPGRIYTRPGGLAYAITPGNAIVHSYNANYPRIVFPRPVLRPAIPAPIPPPVLFQPKPIVPIVPQIPVYTHRYPSIYAQRPFVVPRPIVPLPPVTPQFAVPNFVPTNPVPLPVPVPLPLQAGGVLPQPSLVSQNGWKPLYTSTANIPIAPSASTVPYVPSHSHLNLASSSHSQRPSNYYLPVDPPAHDIVAHSSNDAHLSHENGTWLKTEFNAVVYFKVMMNKNFLFCRTLSATWSSFTPTTFETNPRNTTSWEFLT